MHFDLPASGDELDRETLARRAVSYGGWLACFLGLIALVGLLPAILIFSVLYMRLEGGERWTIVAAVAGGLTVFCWALGDLFLALAVAGNAAWRNRPGP